MLVGVRNGAASVGLFDGTDLKDLTDLPTYFQAVRRECVLEYSVGLLPWGCLKGL